MSKVKIEWKKCEFNLDNIWHNITEIDSINNLQLMALVINSYYKFHNNNTTSALLENELRKRNLNVGLIAVEWEKDSYYKNIIDKGVGVIIKRNHLSHYYNRPTKLSISDVDPTHISKYVTFISCRPRDYVIKETLTYSSSMEENLNKLEIAGDLITFKTEDKLFEGDIKIDQNDINNEIQNGTALIKVEKISYETILKEAKQLYPNANLAVYAIMNDGSPLSALVENGKIVCQIGININYNKEGKQIIRYISL